MMNTTDVLEAGTAKKSVLQVLKLSDIEISNTNPRKRFDETALAELSQSIKTYGVLQPVLVRPLPENGKYELVCGERRYRASKMAAAETVPATIREMSDDEAFEIQIIENLERKDVHPLDEADAFKKMLDCGRYTIADVAAKMAKPEKFIVQRLKLNDLIPEIQQDFFDGECNIGHALLIARLDEDQQKDLYNNYKNNHVHGYGTRQDLLDEIETNALELASAAFNLEAEFPHAGPCTGCAFRTTNNPVLFDDFNAGDSCMKKACFNAKVNHHLETALNDVIDTGKDILIGRVWGDVPEKIKEVASDKKVKILKQYDDYSTYERTGHIKKQLLAVSGEDKGKVIDVWVPSNSNAASVKSISQEIQDIEIKAKRALELDGEKIHKAIIEGLRPEVEEKLGKNFTLGNDFILGIMLYYCIEHVGFWTMRPVLNKLNIDIKDNYKSISEFEEDIAKVTDNQRRQLIAITMFKKSVYSINKDSLTGQFIRKLASHNKNINVDKIEALQKAAADKRIEKTNARLAELNAQLEAETPTKAPKKKK